MEIAVRKFDNKKDRCAYVLSQIEALLNEEKDMTAGLANASAVMNLLLPDLNWVGFYMMRGNGLVLGPFQGKPAVSHIAIGAGVCGTAAQSGDAQLVLDVHVHCNHIACDLASASELVLPIRANGALYALLDMDSPVTGHFVNEDLIGLQPVADAIGWWISQIGV